MTPAQRVSFAHVLGNIDCGKSCEFHHGDCIGADAEAHDITAGNIGTWIVVHPPTDERKRAFKTAPAAFVSIRGAKPYLARNVDIVSDCEYVIACPTTAKPLLRSGTWATIREARRQRRKLYIVYPDGTVAHA